MVSVNHRIAPAAFREPYLCSRANSSYRNRFWKPLSIKNSGYRTRDPFVAETTTCSACRRGSIPCKAIISDVLSMALHGLFSLCLRHLQPFTPTPPQSFHQSIRYSPPPSARPHGGATWKETGDGYPEVGQLMAAALQRYHRGR
jgi:hypothetical protein